MLQVKNNNQDNNPHIWNLRPYYLHFQSSKASLFFPYELVKEYPIKDTVQEQGLHLSNSFSSMIIASLCLLQSLDIFF